MFLDRINMINRIGQAGRVLEKGFFTMGADLIVFTERI